MSRACKPQGSKLKTHDSRLTIGIDIKGRALGWFDVRQRQLDRDRRADTARARDGNRSAVQLDVALRDGQSESRPGRLRREVRLEDLRQRLLIHADARIGDLDDQAWSGPLD